MRRCCSTSELGSRTHACVGSFCTCSCGGTGGHHVVKSKQYNSMLRCLGCYSLYTSCYSRAVRRCTNIVHAWHTPIWTHWKHVYSETSTSPPACTHHTMTLSSIHVTSTTRMLHKVKHDASHGSLPDSHAHCLLQQPASSYHSSAFRGK